MAAQVAARRPPSEARSERCATTCTNMPAQLRWAGTEALSCRAARRSKGRAMRMAESATCDDTAVLIRCGLDSPTPI